MTVDHAEGTIRKEGPESEEPSIMQDRKIPQSTTFYHPSKSSGVPFPSRLKKQKKDDDDERLLSIFKQIHINLPFLEAKIHMPKGGKVLKYLISHKQKLNKASSSVKLSKKCSAVIQRSLPQKEGDPRSFTLPYLIGPLTVKNVMADLEAILEMDEDELVLIILGRPFLSMARAVIDVHEGKLSLRVGNETVTFNIGESMKSKYSRDDYLYCADHTAKIVRGQWVDIITHDGEWVEAEEEGECQASQGYKEPQRSHRLEYYGHKRDWLFIMHSQNPHGRRVQTKHLAPKMGEPKHKDVVVSKKGGMTVVKNEKNELIPQRTVTGTIVFTDHSALRYLFRKQDAKLRLIRWSLLLQEFDIKIHDKKGAENLAADHISRLENPDLGKLTKAEIKDLFPEEQITTIFDKGNEPWNNRKEWSNKLDDALWAFQTTFNTPLGMTTFRIIYCKACHLPVELEHEAYWAIKACNMDLTKDGANRFLQINELDELRLDAYESSISLFPGKLKSRWYGPFAVSKDMKNGAIELYDEDGNEFIVNKQRVKPYQKDTQIVDKDDDITLEDEDKVT
ncbi:reverse transcriptase domain-containing protein [Tanacetum coccineum]